jgi:hypothetical protein
MVCWNKPKDGDMQTNLSFLDKATACTDEVTA